MLDKFLQVKGRKYFTFEHFFYRFQGWVTKLKRAQNWKLNIGIQKMIHITVKSVMEENIKKIKWEIKIIKTKSSINFTVKSVMSIYSNSENLWCPFCWTKTSKEIAKSIQNPKLEEISPEKRTALSPYTLNFVEQNRRFADSGLVKTFDDNLIPYVSNWYNLLKQ